MAKWIKSALVCRPSASIAWYLWNSTVRGEMPSFPPVPI
jgi:hypothetical protein